VQVLICAKFPSKTVSGLQSRLQSSIKPVIAAKELKHEYHDLLLQKRGFYSCSCALLLELHPFVRLIRAAHKNISLFAVLTIKNKKTQSEITVKTNRIIRSMTEVLRFRWIRLIILLLGKAKTYT
jgi:hypothetical protein